MATPLPIRQLRHWLKNDPSPVAKKLLLLAKFLQVMDLPAPRAFFSPIYFVYQNVSITLRFLSRTLFWTPIFKTQLTKYGKALYVYGGMPYISGPLKIEMGNHCRISGKTTLSGRTNSLNNPKLTLGNNIDIGWMTTVAVGSRVILEDNVRIAGQCFLAGYPGHPLNAVDRAKGLPETDAQVGDIILEQDVWLGTGVSVLAGVRIGRGTVVGAASVVTRDLPANVLAAGNPARVIRKIQPSGKSNEGNQ